MDQSKIDTATAVAVAERPRDTRLPLAFAAGLVVLWATAVAVFGLPGLFIPAVLLTPAMFVVLLLITTGK